MNSGPRAEGQGPRSQAPPWSAPALPVQPVPLSLYVHIPWCVRKCPYCDFNSHAALGGVDEAAYVSALLHDLDRECERQPMPALHSIFFGGGTPSLFSADSIARLLDGIARCVSMADDCEITLEANPGSADAARFHGYRAAGVNRLSIGVQSLDDRKLAALGRIHSAREARRAVRLAHAAGFDNLNLDLMYGLPDQSEAEALHDLADLVALQPAHISWYQLTLEPNTRFHARPPALPDSDRLADIGEAGQALLAAAGYRQYEISAYAADAGRCRHNLNYWQFGDYLGVGAGAHGKLTGADGRVERRSKQRHPAAYLRAASAGAVHSARALDRRDLRIEFFLNAMRLVDGVPAGLFEQRTGMPLDVVAGALAEARRRGLLDPDHSVLRPTPLGQGFLNDLLMLFDPG